MLNINGKDKKIKTILVKGKHIEYLPFCSLQKAAILSEYGSATKVCIS